MEKTKNPLNLTINDYKCNKFTVEIEMIGILLEMWKKTKEHIDLKQVQAYSSNIKMIEIDISLESDGIKAKDNIREKNYSYMVFTKCLALTNM